MFERAYLTPLALQCRSVNEESQRNVYKILDFLSSGPRPNTVGDFWKMVWQDHVVIIVMLTNLKEGRKVRWLYLWYCYP